MMKNSLSYAMFMYFCKRMKRYIIIYVFLLIAANSVAQSDRYGSLHRGAVRFVPGSAVLRNDPSTGMSYQSVGSPFITTPLEEVPTVRQSKSEGQVKSDNKEEEVPTDNKPRGEFHASANLSVMAGFGKGAPHGAGFAQNIDAWYTTPLGNKGWLTAGGYLNHINWDGINATGGGVYAELGYRFDDHWSAYVYGRKSVVNSGVAGYGCYYGYPFYGGYYGYNGLNGYNPFGDKLGAAVRWTPNPNFSLQISVEKDWFPKPTSALGYSAPR